MLDLIPQPVLEQCLDMAYDRGRAPLDRAALYGCDRSTGSLSSLRFGAPIRMAKTQCFWVIGGGSIMWVSVVSEHTSLVKIVSTLITFIIDRGNTDRHWISNWKALPLSFMSFPFLSVISYSLYHVVSLAVSLLATVFHSIFPVQMCVCMYICTHIIYPFCRVTSGSTDFTPKPSTEVNSRSASKTHIRGINEHWVRAG